MIIKKERRNHLLSKRKVLLLIFIVIFLLLSAFIIISKPINKSAIEWEWVIKPDIYRDIYFLEGDLFKAYTDEGKVCIIDAATKEVYEYLPFDDIDFDREDVFIAGEDGFFFYVDKTGNKLSDKAYESIYRLKDGLSAVKFNGLWGFIDEDFNKIIDFKFYAAHSFYENYAAVMNKDNKWGFIDKTGELVINYQYDEVKDFHEGLAAVKHENKWAFINESGIAITNTFYDGVKDFNENLAAVEKQSKWGYIDAQGKEVIDCIYDEANDFSEGLAVVKMNDYLESGKEAWAYIDAQGKEKIPFYSYSAIGGIPLLVSDFNSGMAFVSNDLISVINKKGEYILHGGDSDFFISQPVYYENYSAIIGYIYADTAMTRKKYGLLNLNGEKLLIPSFDYIRSIENEYMIVEDLIKGDFRCGVVRLKNGKK